MIYIESTAKGVVMLKHWVIPLAVLILLALAWPYRWEQGPTTNDNNLKTVHVKDRWTGQAWMRLYGKIEIEGRDPDYFSGREVPNFDNEEISEEADDILNSDEGDNQRNLLKAGLEVASQEKAKSREGHSQYVRTIERIKEDFIRSNPEPAIYNATDGGFKHWNWMTEKMAYTENRRKAIPKEVIAANNNWVKYDATEKRLTGQLNNLRGWAEDQATDNLIERAKIWRTVATVIWIILMLGALAAAAYLAAKEKREAEIEGSYLRLVK